MEKDYSYLVGMTRGEVAHELGWWWHCVSQSLPVKGITTEVIRHKQTQLTMTYGENRIIKSIKQVTIID